MGETPEISSFAAAAERGLISREQACEMLGFSWEKVVAQQEAERAHYAKLGLTCQETRRVSRDRDLPAVGSFHG